jgi:hypothetical protein
VALASERHHGSASPLPETANLASGAPTKNSLPVQASREQNPGMKETRKPCL